MENNFISLDSSQILGLVYTPADIIFNLALSFVLGLILSIVYKKTHKGLSYSQSFMLTIIFLTIIITVVMMIIGNNLARAFALVGALSIIRFRTVVKDTKDTAYIFMALAAGMASGTSSYLLGIIGLSFFSLIALVLDYFNYGSFYKSEFILIFRSKKHEDNNYASIISKYAKSASLIHVEQSGDGDTVKLNYDIVLNKDIDPEELVRDLSTNPNVYDISLVASKHDVDY
jgi:hypothetical protein